MSIVQKSFKPRRLKSVFTSQKYAKNLAKFVVLALLSLGFVGCGSDDKTAQGFQGDRAEVAALMVEDIRFAPQLPTNEQFNRYYFEYIQSEPLVTKNITLGLDEGNSGSTGLEIPIVNQNEEAFKVFEDLIFNGKNLSGGVPPTSTNSLVRRFDQYSNNSEQVGMLKVPNKEVYQNIKHYCRDIECVSSNVFGLTWGARFYFKEHFGLSVSGVVNPDTEPYKNDNHVAPVLAAIASFPEGTFPIPKEMFYRGYEIFAENIVIAPHVEGHNPKPGAAAVMVHTRLGGLVTTADIDMFDSWKSQTYQGKYFTVFHELMHLMDATKSQGEQLAYTEGWLKLSRWKEKGAGQWSGSKRYMCSSYGATNPAEDFAECGVLYRFAPETLKQISTRKYMFLRDKVFQGIEYTEDCRDCLERGNLQFF